MAGQRDGQGIRSEKYEVFYRNHNILTADDLLKEVRGQQSLQNEDEFIDTNEDEHAAYLPSPDPEEDDDLSVRLLIE